MQKLIAAHCAVTVAAICVCVGVIMQYVLIAGAEERM